MLFAAIGRINGNSRALEAVLEAIAGEGIFTVVHTGDAVAGAGDGNAVVALLEGNGVLCVQGNLDKLVVRYSRKQDTLGRRLDPDTLELVRRAHDGLTSQHLEVLRDWRKSRQIMLEDLTGFLCHGSPSNPREILTPDTPAVKLQRQREAANADIVVCGGAETPFARMVNGSFFVHPGAIDAGEGLARYTLINTEEPPWTATVENVPY